MHIKKLHTKLVEDSGEYRQDKSILEYYIVERRIGEQYCELKSYGIQIKKISVFPGGRQSEESKLIGDIFFDETDTENFVCKLVENRVSPAEFKSVLDEFVTQTIAMRKREVIA